MLGIAEEIPGANAENPKAVLLLQDRMQMH